MKHLTVIGLTLVISFQCRCQPDLDLKIDSLRIELDILHQERNAIDTQIQKITAEIAELNRRQLHQLRNTTIRVKCAYSTGCSLFSEPSALSKVIATVPYGDSVEVDGGYYQNEYVKGSYGNMLGYLHHGVLEKNHNLETIINSSNTTPLQSKSSSDNGGRQIGRTKSTFGSNNRSIQTGPRGGKYYINSKGNKTYVKKKN